MYMNIYTNNPFWVRLTLTAHKLEVSEVDSVSLLIVSDSLI